MSFLRRKNSRLLEKRLLKLRDLPSGFFAVYDFFDICFVDPFFGKAAVTADVPIDVDRGKDRAAGHDVVAGAVRTGVAVDPDDIAGAALGTAFRIFHAGKPPLAFCFHYTVSVEKSKKLRAAEHSIFRKSVLYWFYESLGWSVVP